MWVHSIRENERITMGRPGNETDIKIVGMDPKTEIISLIISNAKGEKPRELDLRLNENLRFNNNGIVMWASKFEADGLVRLVFDAPQHIPLRPEDRPRKKTAKEEAAERQAAELAAEKRAIEEKAAREQAAEKQAVEPILSEGHKVIFGDGAARVHVTFESLDDRGARGEWTARVMVSPSRKEQITKVVSAGEKIEIGKVIVTAKKIDVLDDSEFIKLAVQCQDRTSGRMMRIKTDKAGVNTGKNGR